MAHLYVRLRGGIFYATDSKQMNNPTFATTFSPQTSLALPPEMHLGNMIEQRLDELGMTKAELGRRLGTSRQNINALLRKQLPPMEQVWLACTALQYDFFADISRQLRAVDPRCTPPIPPDVQGLSANLIRAAMAVVNCALPSTSR